MVNLDRPRIVIAGAGPIGGIIGGRLAREGVDVTLVDVDREHVAAMNQQGLRLEVPDGDFRVPIKAATPDDVAGTYDLGFVAVRAYQTPDVLKWLVPLLERDGVLVSMQNGVCPPVLQAVVGGDRVIGTMIRMGSRRRGPAHVYTNERGHLYVGHLGGQTTPALRAVHALLDRVIPTEITDNIAGRLWSKMTYTCLGEVGGLADLDRRDIWADDLRRGLCVDLLGEVVDAGVAEGIRFEPLVEYDPLDFRSAQPRAEREAILLRLGQEPKGATREGYVDNLKRQNKTEVDYTLGFAVEVAERHGLPAPVSRGVVQLIHEIERGERPLQEQNYQDLAALAAVKRQTAV